MKEECILDVGGPVGDPTYWEQCRWAIGQVPDNVLVRILGRVERDDVPQLLRESDLRVTLTLGENFGHSIAETLQAGTPVVPTKHTPWTELLSAGGGGIVPDRDEPESVAKVLEDEMDSAAREPRERRLGARAAFESWVHARDSNVVEAVARMTRATKPLRATS